MPIVVNLDVMLAKRKMRLKTLSERVSLTEQNLSMIKTGKAKGMRFETLAKICDVLDCQPGDLLEYVPDEEADA
ncbi:helix-turn-helix domain-containing protein [Maritalea myrionectae]|uniref:Putative HTH-type transcriptional regulator YozG n=1 Tax=Maritalea myrionectae TaxID=454601 RepID=A0A2R4MHE4_9HYPH|nr:helix-turn-helix transcriptional regulator [Maritalea myrionectae]AVX05415.1 putative HTH-type transcriptional regulator YozG [Maritalea myrionectae]